MLNQVDSRRQDLQIPAQALQSTYWTTWAKLFNLFAAAPLSLRGRHLKPPLPWRQSLEVLVCVLGGFWKPRPETCLENPGQFPAGWWCWQGPGWPFVAPQCQGTGEAPLSLSWVWIHPLPLVQGVNPHPPQRALPHSTDVTAASSASWSAPTLGFSCSPELELS